MNNIFESWTIVVTCISAICTAPIPPPEAYPTKEQCEIALVRMVNSFDPGMGAYTFNCRRWPW